MNMLSQCNRQEFSILQSSVGADSWWETMVALPDRVITRIVKTQSVPAKNEELFDACK